MTNIVFGSSGKPGQTTNRVTAERRLGDTVLYEQVGTTTYQGGDLTYQYDAQGAPASTGKKLWEKFLGGTSGFLVERLGILNSTTPIATNRVNVYPVSLGPSMVTEAGDGEAGESAAMCTYAITAPPAFDSVVV